MERNQIMKDVINHLKNRLDGADGSKQDGFKKRVSEIEEMVNRNDSTEFIPFANKEAFATYNHAEDLKDEGARTEDILYAEGEYKAYEAFLEKFNKWLAKQDEVTILKHSVNEEISIRDEVRLPYLKTPEERLAFHITSIWLRGYEQDEYGNITSVKVQIGEQNKEVTFDEFNKLFEIDHITYLK